MTDVKSSRQVILTEEAPVVAAPISQGIVHDSVLYTGGQAGIMPQTGALVGSDFASQARQALTNLAAVARAAGTSLDQALKVTVYLASMEDYPALNAIYSAFFPYDPPARKVIQAGLLPGLLVEFDAIIALPTTHSGGREHPDQARHA